MIEKTITIPIFEDYITLMYGTQKELFESFIGMYPDFESEYDRFYAKYWSLDDNGDLRRYILVAKGEGEEYVHHEALHATNDILHCHGIEVNNQNDEIQCKLMDFIAMKINKIIKSK